LSRVPAPERQEGIRRIRRRRRRRRRRRKKRRRRRRKRRIKIRIVEESPEVVKSKICIINTIVS